MDGQRQQPLPEGSLPWESRGDPPDDRLLRLRGEDYDNAPALRVGKGRLKARTRTRSPAADPQGRSCGIGRRPMLVSMDLAGVSARGAGNERALADFSAFAMAGRASPSPRSREGKPVDPV